MKNSEHNRIIVSKMDEDHLRIVRTNVACFLEWIIKTYIHAPGTLLDIAPQEHGASRPVFPDGLLVETLDIDPMSGCTYIGDITKRNDVIADSTYDYIICTEVLEHTLQPFDAVHELRRLLRPGGYLFLSVPFNFRIHGPLPDCWRFTEHGLRALLSDYVVEILDAVPTPGRDLMPIHYTVVARRYPFTSGVVQSNM